LSRSKLEQLVDIWCSGRSSVPCRAEGAGLKAGDIDEVILVGA